MTRIQIVVATLVAGIAVAACGSAGGTATSTGGGDSTAVEAELDVVVTAGKDRSKETRTVVCPPEEEDRDTAACEALANVPTILEETQRGLICTQQYGGPDRAVVTGTLNGRGVDTEFSLRNGCEISRWERAIPVIGEPPTQSRPQAPGGQVVQ